MRDAYVLEAASSEAEVNPTLRHRLRELYDLVLPEHVDLRVTSIEELHRTLVDQIEASEPAVSLRLVDKPRIDLVQRQARLRVEVFRRRQAGATRRAMASRAGVDHSYDRADFRPLGIQLFARKVRMPPMPQRTSVGGSEERTPESMVAPVPAPSDPDQPRLHQTYSVRRGAEVGDPYSWELDLCRLTLGNFSYRRMTLVQDYQRLIEEGAESAAFEEIFRLGGRPLTGTTALPATADQLSVVDSDATQLRAVSRAASGTSYVIQGPPGTGKSQTITNLIADAVGRGRRVLFVCEKRAAIDVVFHRLRQLGLDQLCCLVHDSQTDKKSLIQELKASYETAIEGGDRDLAGLEAERTAVVERIDEEMADLSRLSSVLHGEVADADRDALALIDHLIRLRTARGTDGGPDADVELAAAEEELLPDLRHWWPASGPARRLERALSEVTDAPCIAAHPVCRLGRRVLGADRPYRQAQRLLEHARRRLEEISSPPAPVPATGEVPIVDLLAMADACATVLAPLAHLGALDLVDPLATRAAAVDQLIATFGQRSADHARSSEEARGWRQPPDPGTSVRLLGAARRREGTSLSGLSGEWREARRLVAERYDPPPGVPSSVTAPLEALVRHQEDEAHLAQLRAYATEHFGTGDVTSLGRLVRDGRALRMSPVKAVASLASRAARGGDGPTEVIALAARRDELHGLAATLDELLGGHEGDGGLEAVVKLIDGIEAELDLLPSLLDALRAMDEVDRSVTVALGALAWPVDVIETAAARRALDRWFGEDRAVARLDGAAIERRVASIATLRRDLLAVNVRLIRARARGGFLEHLRISSQPSSRLRGEEAAFAKGYAGGRRELEHEFGKVMATGRSGI